MPAPEALLGPKYQDPDALINTAGVRIPAAIVAPVPEDTLKALQPPKEYLMDGPITDTPPVCELLFDPEISTFGEAVKFILEDCNIEWDSQEDVDKNGWLTYRLSEAAYLNQVKFFDSILRANGFNPEDPDSVGSDSKADLLEKYGNDHELRLRIDDGLVNFTSIYGIGDLSLDYSSVILNAALFTEVDQEKLAEAIQTEAQNQAEEERLNRILLIGGPITALLITALALKKHLKSLRQRL